MSTVFVYQASPFEHWLRLLLKLVDRDSSSFPAKNSPSESVKSIDIWLLVDTNLYKLLITPHQFVSLVYLIYCVYKDKIRVANPCFSVGILTAAKH